MTENSINTNVWDSLSLDLVSIQVEGKIVFINTAGAQMLGAASPEQLIGRALLDFVHPDYREIAINRTRQMIEGGAVICPGAEKWRRLDGRSIDVEVAAMPLVYQGKPALQLIARQDTPRKSRKPTRNCGIEIRRRGQRQRWQS